MLRSARGNWRRAIARGTSPVAYSTFSIGDTSLVHLCSLPLHFVRMKKVVSTWSW
jgi:hypothetical protein